MRLIEKPLLASGAERTHGTVSSCQLKKVTPCMIGTKVVRPIAVPAVPVAPGLSQKAERSRTSKRNGDQLVL